MNIPAKLKKLLIFITVFFCGYTLAYEPKGSIEELYGIENLPLLRSGVKCKMFSSYDRTGGNDDGFNGTYSKLRVENGNSVIAEMEGAGCVQRIWFTHSVINKDGLLDLKGEHIQVFLDGNEEPAIDVPLEDLFSGKLEQFPKPLVGSALGGFYCYVPIAYQNGCKIVIEGTGVRFYHVTYNEFADSKNVETFTMNMTPVQKEQLAKAVKVWSSLGDVESLNITNPETLDYDLSLGANETKTIELPNGKYMVRAVLFTEENTGNEKNLDGQIQFTWDDAQSPAVDLPLPYFFGQAFSPEPYQSLLLGNYEGSYYNFMPMPYNSSANIKITVNEALNGKITIILEPISSNYGEFGYFHANYQENKPVEDGLHYMFLNTSGTGHYIGTYLVTEGARSQPVWLEGDEKFTVDGEPAIHGTGSEDYFNCGWYAVENRLNQAMGMPLHGFPVYRSTDKHSQAVAYRWHLTEPVPYENKIEAKIEHGISNSVTADYRSTVFFYDVNPSQKVNDKMILKGDECIDYLNYRVFQLAHTNPEEGLSKVNELSSYAERSENKILLEGLKNYLEGILTLEQNHMSELNLKLEVINESIDAQVEDTSKSLLDSQRILQRAKYDLEREMSSANGFVPGSELIVEVRDLNGDLTPGPLYTETEDFIDSYAKADDPHLMGKGARFTYGGDKPSWAKVSPDFPETGFYEVLVIFSWGANASSTKYEIKHVDGADTIPLEQRGRPGTSDRNNGIWHSLGTYKFEKGFDPGKGSVILHTGDVTLVPNKELSYRGYADSFRFIYKGKSL